MSEALPRFRYYPDPVAGGSVERSPKTCTACGQARGYICTCTIYGAGVPRDAELCPWCVADGTAHTRLDAMFNDVDGDAPREAMEEVVYRTPGFTTWQDWGWPAHCDDMAVYLGERDGEQLRENADAYANLLGQLRQLDWGEDEVSEFVDGLGQGPVAYLFECRHCGKQLVVWDES